jgi:hypothetical protein
MSRTGLSLWQRHLRHRTVRGAPPGNRAARFRGWRGRRPGHPAAPRGTTPNADLRPRQSAAANSSRLGILGGTTVDLLMERTNMTTVTTGYQHRCCLACRKRIPRWEKGRETKRLFCDAQCSAYHRKTHQKRPKSGWGSRVAETTETAQKVPAPQQLSEPVSAVEGKPEYRPCRACGRSTRDDYCSSRCRDFKPLSDRKADGAWFVVAGPAPFCDDCGLALTPGHGVLLPRCAADGKLRCDPCHATAMTPAKRPKAKPAPTELPMAA